MYFFSPIKKAFFNLLINGNSMPPDAVEIPESLYLALLDGQSMGRPIVVEGGMPALAAISPGADHDWVGGKWVLNRARYIAETKRRLGEAVQAHLEAKAKELGYDSLLSAISYADETSVPQFQKEGQALRAWRSAVWACCLDLIDGIEKGQAVPTEVELLSLLPPVPAL